MNKENQEIGTEQKTKLSKLQVTPLNDEIIIKRIAFKIHQVKTELHKNGDTKNVKILEDAEQILLKSTNVKFPAKEKQQLFTLSQIIN
jgi:hypothetical protein